jgi:hypothetical protein
MKEKLESTENQIKQVKIKNLYATQCIHDMIEKNVSPWHKEVACLKANMYHKSR